MYRYRCQKCGEELITEDPAVVIATTSRENLRPWIASWSDFFAHVDPAAAHNVYDLDMNYQP